MNQTEIAAKRTRKLQSALIEIGKEVDEINGTPDLHALEVAFVYLKCVMKANDMKGMRKYGRQLAAKVTRLMVDEL